MWSRCYWLVMHREYCTTGGIEEPNPFIYLLCGTWKARTVPEKKSGMHVRKECIECAEAGGWKKQMTCCNDAYTN